jgi:galactokinase
MFKEIFGSPPATTVTAPGRVNLLGEHTDYNGGFVLPTPIPYLTTLEAAPSHQIEGYAHNLDQKLERDLEAPAQNNWLDYVAGCVQIARRAGFPVEGLRVSVRSEVPMGAGLSSSAALEVATLRALRQIYQFELSDRDLALLAQQAEVEYVGVRCGVMDQMACSLGQPGQALFLDTRSLKYQLVALPPGYRVAVVESGVPRRLAEAGYNTRRAECEQAAALLGVRELRDVSLQELGRVEQLPSPLAQRVHHVVTENGRVLEGVEALAQQQYQRFGQLMVASHRSLQYDYEVSVPQLDQLVELALRHGALGARLTGAGFGGAIVALVAEEDYPAFAQGLLSDYPRARLY